MNYSCSSVVNWRHQNVWSFQYSQWRPLAGGIIISYFIPLLLNAKTVIYNGLCRCGEICNNSKWIPLLLNARDPGFKSRERIKLTQASYSKGCEKRVAINKHVGDCCDCEVWKERWPRVPDIVEFMNVEFIVHSQVIVLHYHYAFFIYSPTLFQFRLWETNISL